MGEQVRRTHQQAYTHAQPGQRSGQGSDHGRGAGIMNTATEPHPDSRGGARWRGRKKLVDNVKLRFPQGEAGTGADVAAALGAFEHETARTGLQELPKETRRGNMQERGNARLLEFFCLSRPATRDNHAWGLDLPDNVELRDAQIIRHEPEDTHSPGPLTCHRASGPQHRLRLLAV